MLGPPRIPSDNDASLCQLFKGGAVEMEMTDDDKFLEAEKKRKKRREMYVGWFRRARCDKVDFW